MNRLMKIISQQARVLKRAAKTISRRNKTIELLYFTYKHDPETDDTVIIRFAFRNALWYVLDGDKTFEGRHVIVKHGTTVRKIILTVQGFFRKAQYTIFLGKETVYIKET